MRSIRRAAGRGAARIPTLPRTRKSAGATPPDDAQIARRPGRPKGPPPGWVARITDDATLEQALERLSDETGVYIMRDRKGEILYVGKAARLRSRVRQYFNGTDTRMFVPMLSGVVGDIETVVTSNVKEALLLENNLIKQHRPRFNVKLRDDSNYLVLRLDPAARWPRLELVRKVGHDGASYFGPYHSASNARSTLRVVNRHFKLRTCTDFVLGHRTRPCLQFQIDRCPAPCVREVDPAAYAEQVGDVALFLSGRHRELTSGLRKRMETASTTLDFETAARVRDQLHAIETTLESQQIVGTDALDQDAFGMYREGGQVELVVMHVRQGKLLQTQAFSQRGMELPDAEVLGDFVDAYYDQAGFVPDEVVLPAPLHDDDHCALVDWLWERKGRKVNVLVPERGDRRKLVALASRNAASSFATRRNRREDTDAALERLQHRLGLSRLPRVIECYDVSHLQGTDTVASMIVFVDGAADKSRYRTFRVKGVQTGDEGTGLSQGSFQNDDFASMYEVLGRRFRRALQGGAVRSDAEDESGWALPDLIVIDGGKGQLGRVLAAMADLGVGVGAEGVDVVALAKERKDALGRGRAALERLRERRQAEGAGVSEDREIGAAYVEEMIAEGSPGEWEIKPERVFVPGIKDPINLRPGSSERYLMERVRDEAHRFAISHHRKRRAKRTLHSTLDDIDGVGPALKRALVRHFGSIAAIREASPAALGEVKGIGPALAARIHAALGGG